MRNDSVKQYLMIAVILLLIYIIGWQLYIFFPGLLGAVTLYIIMRQPYFHLTIIKNWKKGRTALLFILVSIIVFVLPLIGLIDILLPKFNALIENSNTIPATLKSLSVKLQTISPQLRINQEQIIGVVQKLTSSIPGILNATANMLTNTVLAFFILYYMLVDGRKMEQAIHKFLPLKPENIDNVWEATRTMVISNAIGIPVLAASQGIAAMLGYFIFGIEDYVLWGVITGIVSVVPLVGCMLVWGPLCVYLFAIGHTGAAIGLLIYSFVITGGIDNVLRFTILKKIGDVHPIITALGIIVGLPLFGFMGFIFGPLIISYLLLLMDVYKAEFSGASSPKE
ncbi:MAG: AI-2E family transporter [Bacteroidetes bacterium]|nr:AI-2E family transporter [Bacteroidota bacterium]